MTPEERLLLLNEVDELVKCCRLNMSDAKSWSQKHTGYHNAMVAAEQAALDAAKRAAILLERIGRE